MVLLLLPAISFVLSALFSVPLSRAFIRSGAHSRGGVTSDGGSDAGAMMARMVWRRLRWWFLLWSLAAAAFLYCMYVDYSGASSAGTPIGPFLRLAHAVADLLFFYGPLPYMLVVCLHLAPKCVRWRSLFLWTHFGGWTVFGLACAAVSIGLGTILRCLDFTLPGGGYNPGYPDPDSTLVYATSLGIALACCSLSRYLRRAGRNAPSGAVPPEGLQGL